MRTGCSYSVCAYTYRVYRRGGEPSVHAIDRRTQRKKNYPTSEIKLFCEITDNKCGYTFNLFIYIFKLLVYIYATFIYIFALVYLFTLFIYLFTLRFARLHFRSRLFTFPFDFIYIFRLCAKYRTKNNPLVHTAVCTKNYKAYSGITNY